MKVISISPNMLQNSKSAEFFPKSHIENNNSYLTLPRLKKISSELTEDSVFPD